jgi:hypothetical protein
MKMATLPKGEALAFADMKIRWAQKHFDALQKEIERWLNLPAYTAVNKTDLDGGYEIWRIALRPQPMDIPMLLGDFVCCLRSGLEQLAWGLAHLDTKRILSDTDNKNISFLIAKDDDSTYRNRTRLFPPVVASVLDTLQPYHRGNAFRDDPLWKLNELWNLDKHRTIPINSSSLHIRFPMDGWERFVSQFTNHVEVKFPLIVAWPSPVELKPEVTVEIHFGEYMGSFEVSVAELKEINDFVRNDVIPRFAGFFA